MAIAYLSLGSNMGDRRGYLQQALEALARKGARVLRVSSIFETKPWGPVEQSDYLNAAAQVATDLLPSELLRVCLEIERELGRERTLHWGPRVIDIDLLLYELQTINTENLIVPHPYLTERAFVLESLAEIAPDLKLPDGRGIHELLNEEQIRTQEVRVFKDGFLSLPGA